MSRGCKRKHNQNIPSHIDQSGIPKGVYYDHRNGGSWYHLYKDETGRQRRQNIADAYARLSDLHKIIEEIQGVDRGTLSWLCAEFHLSPQFNKLSLNSKEDYKYSRDVVLMMPTKIKNKNFGDLSINKLSAPLIQRLIDKVAKTHPSKAAHALRYLRRVFRWGHVRGYCAVEPVLGLEAPQERKRRRLPSEETYKKLLNYAVERGKLPRGTQGACPEYLSVVMEIAYLCRLRGIEVVTLTDKNMTEEGLLSNRRKGSRDNITAWTPRLRDVCQKAIAIRAAIWDKRRYPIPADLARRPLIVSCSGAPLSKSGFDTAWQRFIKMAIAEHIVEVSERFALHDLKRKGITDTPGNRADKQQASGHKSASMMDTYDFSLPIVQPSTLDDE